MYKKIYAIKNGDKPGIYTEWLEVYQIIEKLDHIESKTFKYKVELETASADVEYSYAWAMKQARLYLGEEPLSDKSKEEQEKLPFDDVGEEEVPFSMPQNTGGKKEEQKDPEEEETDPEEEEMDPEEEEMDSQEEETDPEEEADKWDRTIHEKLGVKKQFGSPWADMILEISCNSFKGSYDYTERYFPVKVYSFLLQLVLAPKKIWDYMYTIKSAGDDYDDDDEDPNWRESLEYELHHSEEYKKLRAHIADELGMKALDIKDVAVRTAALSRKRFDAIVSEDVSTSLALKKFLEQGQITIWNLYQELVTRQIYRAELRALSKILHNPDLDREIELEQKSLKQIVLTSNAIQLELKQKVIGQDGAIDKLEKAYFHNEKIGNNKKGPKNVFLFAGPPGVGKTYTAELFASILGIPYKRFDMSGYAHPNSLEELEGISTFWKNAKAGVLTSYVHTHPECVLLFDEIEKAGNEVIRLFLQIIDDGECLDRFYDERIPFHNCTIIFTTNAGHQLYQGAEGEDLTALSDKIVVDALEKDLDPEKKTPYFPPELVSRLSSNTIIMFNHLKSNGIRRVVLSDIDKHIRDTKERYGIDLDECRNIIAATAQFSVGGSKDARNASKLAGKIIDKELYELLLLIEEKTGLNREDFSGKITFRCDFTGVEEEVRSFYSGEADCCIVVFAEEGSCREEQRNSALLEQNRVSIRFTTDLDEYRELLRKENVLFVVNDYRQGIEAGVHSLSVLDIRSKGREAFHYTRESFPDLPVFVLMGEDSYTDREIIGFKNAGAEAMILREEFQRSMEQCYNDVCCNNAVDTLMLKHQIVSYKTRKEYDEEQSQGTIIFYGMTLENAVDSEDKGTMLADDLRPDKHWEDIWVSNDVREELEFFIEYLKSPDVYARKGVRPPKGALMYGPPGTGKTSLAKVVASESNVSFLATTGDELAGMTSEGVHQIFRVARKYAPCVLFIDEIDAIGANRMHAGIQPNLNSLLTEMDGFATVENKPVFVMAATNLGGAIDPALVRRFDRSFSVNYPREEGVKWLLERLLHKNEAMFQISEDEIESLVERAGRISPAEIEKFVEMALREGIRSDTIVDDAVLDEAFEKSRYGEEQEDNLEEEVRQTAIHEAGHAIVQLYYGGSPSYMSVVARGNFNGYLKPAKLGGHPTKEMLLQQVCCCLGGRAAEQENGYGITPGASADLKQATELVKQMVCSFGMYEEEIGLAVITEEAYIYDTEARKLVNRILSEQLKQAGNIMKEKREELIRLADGVLVSKKKYLTQKEIESCYKGEKEYECK